jgi:hypothetical protein
LAWEIPKAPAPIAIVVKTFIVSESKPNGPNIGAMMEAVVIVFSGALRGAGDTFWAMCISVSMHWIIVPVLYIMLKVLDTSAEAGWVAYISISMFFAGLFYLRHKSGKWKTIKVIDHEEEVPLPHSDFHETPDL